MINNTSGIKFVDDIFGHFVFSASCTCEIKGTILGTIVETTLVVMIVRPDDDNGK